MTWKPAVICEDGKHVVIERGPKPDLQHSDYDVPEHMAIRNYITFDRDLAAWNAAGEPISIAPELLKINRGDLVRDKSGHSWRVDDVSTSGWIWTMQFPGGVAPGYYRKYPPSTRVEVKITEGIVTDIELT